MNYKIRYMRNTLYRVNQRYTKAPHLLFPQFLNEDSLKERADGIAMGLELLLGCDEMWVFGEATEGMEQEIRFAVEHGIHIWFKEDAEGGSGV